MNKQTAAFATAAVFLGAVVCLSCAEYYVHMISCTLTKALWNRNNHNHPHLKGEKHRLKSFKQLGPGQTPSEEVPGN